MKLFANTLGKAVEEALSAWIPTACTKTQMGSQAPGPSTAVPIWGVNPQVEGLLLSLPLSAFQGIK